MTDAALWSAWSLWMGVAAVLVAVAAGLLLAIIQTARAIVREAGRAAVAAEAIRANTQPVWELQTSNTLAEGLLATVRAIEEKGAALVEAVGHGGPRR